MFERLKAIFSRPTQVDVTPRQQQQEPPHHHNIFNLPPGWKPIDSVIKSVRIPGTSLELGSAARVVETDQDERLDFDKLHGILAGCSHFIYSIEQIGGKCFVCELESIELLKQNLITLSQAEERSLYCTQCASYCMACFKRVCATHTKLFLCPNGIYIPLCWPCHEHATRSFLDKLIAFIKGCIK
ncbi:MAG: hypothetical protein A2Y10_14800 [Planctomycetes bacterium GWF2_41_51]|nr:MAG: hypothetical protein A2Y10_14800 [Planctomycetes bacterium GWF2_41_51]HBG28988.1 hypothetical protein [Phycisphaerales bacterium]